MTGDLRGRSAMTRDLRGRKDDNPVWFLAENTTTMVVRGRKDHDGGGSWQILIDDGGSKVADNERWMMVL
ncbi:hypothetical protein Patl1_10918 [Pistacia atlantica]|uniref:Uncharacterized protein n=1 Tax=Pistacia atlantica TaxID=434234 RepID=A0ACC1A6A4_9ROSI|nr:hypothetical protein Patl1_10918 [Pistacia atlantica]